MLPTDWSRPSRLVQRRISDPRAIQFWDKDHLVAKELRAHLPDGRPDCCSRNGILWDVVAVYPKSANWASPPAFVEGPVIDAAPDAAKELVALTGRSR
jgi:hypothetical protein